MQGMQMQPPKLFPRFQELSLQGQRSRPSQMLQEGPPLSGRPPLSNSLRLPLSEKPRPLDRSPLSAEPPLSHSLRLPLSGERPLSGESPLSLPQQMQSKMPRPLVRSPPSQVLAHPQKLPRPSLCAESKQTGRTRASLSAC